MRKTAIKYQVPVLAGSWYVVHRGVAHAAKQIKNAGKRSKFLQKNTLNGVFDWNNLPYIASMREVLVTPHELNLLRQKNAVIVSNTVNMTVWTVARIKSLAKKPEAFGVGEAAAVNIRRGNGHALGGVAIELKPEPLRRGRQML